MTIIPAEYKTVFRNFANLAFVQAIGLILPLLTTPYVIRKVGIDVVGLVAVATSVISYFGILINYGFNLTATREIANNVHSQKAVNFIFRKVFYSKVLLSVFSLMIFGLVVLFSKAVSADFVLYFSLLLSTIFTNLSCDWFYQGVQSLDFFSKLNVVAKVAATLLIFILVRGRDDYFYLGVIPFLSSLILFVFSQRYLNRRFRLSYRWIGLRKIKKELVATRYIFFSQVKVSFFNNFNILVVGLLTNNTAAGIFSSADKIIKVFSSVQIPVVTALFPHFASKLKSDRMGGWREINRIAKLGSGIYGFILLMLFISASWISQIMFGTHVAEISLLIRIMSVIPLFVFLNNLYGTQFLLHIGKDRVFFAILLVAAIFNAVTVLLLTHFYNVEGTAVSILITEAFVLGAMYYFARKYLRS